MNKKRFCVVLLTLIGIFVLCSCKSSKTETKEKKMTYDLGDVSSSGEVEHTSVKFEIDGIGEFVAQMYPEYAPQTVSAFLELVDNEYYNGCSFEKVFPGRYMLSSENKETSKNSNIKINGEFYKNGVSNSMPLEKGTLVMMHPDDDYDGALTQFMIMFADNKDMAGMYAPFAKVTSGTEVLDKLASMSTDKNNTPISPIVMKKVSVVE